MGNKLRDSDKRCYCEAVTVKGNYFKRCVLTIKKKVEQIERSVKIKPNTQEKQQRVVLQ